jgi:DNA-directed DNA polymerase III PolC
MAFIHLHVHSIYSLLDGTCHLEELIEAAQAAGMPALALTDHNALYGAIPFYDLCRQAGLQPILGMEATMTDGHSLVLLAQNEEGYRNLCRLSTILQAFSDPPPRLPWAALRHHSEGLFALTGGRAGWITELVRQDQLDRAQRLLGGLLALFGQSNVLMELEIHRPEDVPIVERLIELAEDAEIAYVATNDVHHLHPHDAPRHLLLSSIHTRTYLLESDPQKPNWRDNQPPPRHFRTPAEMEDLFSRWPRAISNSGYVANRCHLQLEVGRPIFPRAPLPDAETAFSRLWKLAFQGAAEHYQPLTPTVINRLHHELHIIEKMGYSPYFLIVADIAAEARRRGIPVLGRGSAASSLVAYTLGITPVDPLAHKLTFERFLHPERVDPPDIDLDLCWRRRDEILDYVYRTYCDSHVAMIGTYNTFRTRSAVRETGKAFGLADHEIEAVLARHWADMFQPEEEAAEPEDGPTWVVPPEPPADRLTETILKAAQSIAGLPRHLSIHCGGLVIAPTPITELVPLQRSAKGLLITQYDMHAIERLGLVKMDLLGVRALTAVADAVAAARHGGASQLTVEDIPTDDPTTFDLLTQGMTIGCFQLESPGVRALLRRYQPQKLEDVMTVISLFRPAPLRGKLKDTFLQRRCGQEPVRYPLPDLPAKLQERVAEILGETYGVILYQEQALRLLSEVGGLSLSQAESIRRALPENPSGPDREKLKKRFMLASTQEGRSKTQAQQIWELLAGFTGYAFCKAHAASYAVVAYRSVYLKAHYPAEYMAAVIENEGGYYNPAAYAEEARRLGLHILPPHVNDPHLDTRGCTDTIRIGLRRVRGVSPQTRQRILEEARLTPFTSLHDFLWRVQPQEKEAKQLIRIGACDNLGGNRAELIWELYAWLSLRGTHAQGQLGLPTPPYTPPPFEIPDLPAYTLAEKIRWEKEILGLAVSDHPLSLYVEKLARYRPVGSALLPSYVGEEVIVAGWPVGVRSHRTRQGEWMVFLSLEDLAGTIEVLVFPDVYQRCTHFLGQAAPHLVQGRVQEEAGEVLIIAGAVWVNGNP